MRRTARSLCLILALAAVVAGCGQTAEVTTVNSLERSDATTTPAPTVALPDERDTVAKALARTVQVALETYYTSHQTYRGGTLEALYRIEPTLLEPSDVDLGVDGLSDMGYRITAVSPTGTTVQLHNRKGIITRDCAPATSGACTPDGHW